VFSYRHGFHAGNHADVLKHLVLVQLLKRMTVKDKALLFVDTHAGGGTYALDEGFAAKSAESATGIARLRGGPLRAPALVEYLAEVARFDDGPAPTRYPGSPQLASQLLRGHDRLRLFEAHTTEIEVLREWAGPPGRRTIVTFGDGFAGLRSVLPPPSRRALVLIDPSYEDKQDYRRVIETLEDAFRRFATGTYAVWYPQVSRRESARLPEQLRAVAPGDWLHASLTVREPDPGGRGLHGSGMFVFNPPWQLDVALQPALPELVTLLGQGPAARFGLESRLT
jgi:23S rRNA (adenine2030-N6)-methyltransferase